MIGRKAVILVLVALLPAVSVARPPLKVYISADMEGIAGVVTKGMTEVAKFVEFVPSYEPGLAP